MQGSFEFDADVQTVWDALLSPQTLESCIPGCRRFESSGDDVYEVEMNVRVAAVGGLYKGEVRIEDRTHLESYTMIVLGSGRAGSVQGSGKLRFSESDGRATVHVEGDTQVTGVIARVGQRLIGGASRMLMNRFFDCLRSKVEAR